LVASERYLHRPSYILPAKYKSATVGVTKPSGELLKYRNGLLMRRG
jgi:hypothetical protein